MESFYGGRKGTPFIIVDGFHSIDLMNECFAEGASTTNKVNYGEYVIIDTYDSESKYTKDGETYTPRKNDPDNGKVYRRGFEGAEYIGQIIGPQGETPELEINSIKTILQEYSDATLKEYTVTEEDLVSGKENDTVKYTSVTVKDEFGNVTGAIIGFRIPYLVQEFTAKIVEPYGINESTELCEQKDDDTHPFYHQYELNIPKGIHGTDLVKLELEPTAVKQENGLEVQIYDNNYEIYSSLVLSFDGVSPISNDSGILNQDKIYKVEADEANSEYYILKDNPNYRVLASDCGSPHLFVTTKDYSNSSEGEDFRTDLGAVKDIEDIVEEKDENDITTGFTIYYSENRSLTIPIVSIGSLNLEDNGELTVKYTNREDSTTIGIIKSIKSLTVGKDRRLKVDYNTSEVEDVGEIKATFGIHIYQNYDNEDVVTTLGAPEDIGGEVGDCITIGAGDNTQLYYYNYSAKKWQAAGSMALAGDAIADPTEVISLNTDIEDNLQEKGFKCTVETVYFAE